MTPKSSILYQNADATIFLLDIPTSIALAQELPPQTTSPGASPDAQADTTPDQNIPGEQDQGRKKNLLSSPPLKSPYTPTEPKTEAARAKVLASIPRSQRDFASSVEPLLSNALVEIRRSFREDLKWCLPRCLLGRLEPESHGHEDGSPGEAVVRLGKRKRWSAEKYPNALGTECNFQPGCFESTAYNGIMHEPPLILASGMNRFRHKADICNQLVKNTSSETATVQIPCSYRYGAGQARPRRYRKHRVMIPPLSNFLICTLPLVSTESTSDTQAGPIPQLPRTKRFNLILLDPPWSNRSVQRSGHYQTQSRFDTDMLTQKICDILGVHSYSPSFSMVDEEPNSTEKATQSKLSIAAIWIVNSVRSRKVATDSLKGAGFTVSEEWVWIKTTVDGQPVTPVNGLWRKPYEVLLIGRRRVSSEADSAGAGAGAGIRRRVIAAVPDVHSRKPNLREVFETVFFADGCPGPGPDSAGVGRSLRYSALEVFARNLTAGWWAVGNEVLKFNSEEWWTNDEPECPS
ncbi:hypothetical protein BJX61DRAFT_519253 [Aspergillus egyptiacus]|nr:hypothetical protein BJX61DRAFT_519253 [Aspergillus egyptiacus]